MKNNRFQGIISLADFDKRSNLNKFSMDKTFDSVHTVQSLTELVFLAQIAVAAQKSLKSVLLSGVDETRLEFPFHKFPSQFHMQLKLNLGDNGIGYQ